jgi:predicted dienelactone hydrolase
VQKHIWQSMGWFIALLLSQAVQRPGIAADRIYVNYSIFGRSISIQSLETFAREGRVSGDLASYTRYLRPKQLAQLREGLKQKVDFPAIAISQFLYSPTGEIFLDRGSRIIQTPVNRGSAFALRSALILAAQDPEGLTPLSILRYYPSAGVVVNLTEVVEVVNDINKAFKETASVTETIQATTKGQSLPAAEVGQLLQLERPGPLKWQKVTFDLQDNSEKRLRYTNKVRSFPIDVYLPDTTQPQPVVVISHGLNSDRQSYAYLAQRLASYGFGVIVPEHPGSNKQRLQALFEGFGRDVAEPVEFLDRPLDIQFLLDAVQKLSNEDPNFKNKLDLQNVGIIGQSFGGYTALASVGAPLNFEQLRQDCSKRLNTTLNISLILQCQALRLPAAPYQLADPRIKAAIAINPFASAVFGPKSMAKVQVPTLIVAGSADVVAPALDEQVRPFSALTTQKHYLALIQNSTHFSTIAPSVGTGTSLDNLRGVAGPFPGLARNYIQVLSLAFMQLHLRNQTAYQPFLSPSGAASLSQSPLPLSIVTTLPAQAPIPEISPPKGAGKN